MGSAFDEAAGSVWRTPALVEFVGAYFGLIVGVLGVAGGQRAATEPTAVRRLYLPSLAMS
jgi:hypothetical protein